MAPLNYGATLVTRSEWGARRPKSVTGLTADRVTSHWEGPHMGTFPHSACAGKVRGIQDFHMDSRGWSDIAYNAVACPHGFVFEGRGRGVRSAANGTNAGNSGAFAICYLGGVDDPFTDAGERAMKAGGDWLTHPGSARNAHRDWKSTECPGNTIYAWTHAGQPVDAPAPPPPSILPAPENEMHLLVKGNGNPTYWLVFGQTRRRLDNYEESDQAVWDRVATESRLNEARKAWGLAPVQLVAHNGLAVKEDGKQHFEPFVWSQGEVDNLVDVAV